MQEIGSRNPISVVFYDIKWVSCQCLLLCKVKVRSIVPIRTILLWNILLIDWW